MAETTTSPPTSAKVPASFLSVEIPRLCAGGIEAVWLSAVVLVPCLCNPHAASGFQPSKIAFLRLLALIAAAAWITKSAGSLRPIREIVRETVRVGRRVPFLAAVAVLVFSYAISTAFSVNPYDSLWGSYETVQGSFTLGCVVIFFAALAVHLRRPEQIERLVTTITVTSFPLALYGLMERAGYDSLPQLSHFRVFSLLGHPMYFAAYLLLVMPLCLWRILRLAGEFRAGPGRTGWCLGGLALYGLILAAQILAFVFTESRGALLGLIAGLGFFMCATGVLRRRRTTLIFGLGLVVIILAVLVLANRQAGPFKRWASLPLLHRFSQTFSQKEAAAAARLDYWKATVKLMTRGEPLALGPAEYDHWHWMRPLVGYGPETVPDIFPRVYFDPEVDHNPENRVHNLVLDAWLNLGALGVAALIACFILIFFQVYRYLRWVCSARGMLLFFGLALGMPLATATVLMLWRGPGLLGVGIQCGVAAGLTLYPVAAFLFGINDAAAAKALSQKEIFLLALLGALLAHLVETAFGFETAATSLLIWIYPAIILALTRQDSTGASDDLVPAMVASNAGATEVVESRGNNGQSSAGSGGLNRHSALVSAALTALMLVCLLFAFIQRYSVDRLSVLAVLQQALTQLDNGDRTNPYLLPLFFVAWLWCGLAFALDQARENSGRGWRKHLLITLVVSILFAGAYAWLTAFQISKVGPVPDSSASSESVLQQCSGYILICLVFLGILVGFVFWIGWLISRNVTLPRGKPGPVFAAGLFSAAAAILLVSFTTIRFLRADVSCRWAKVLGTVEDVRQAADVLKYTLSLNPRPLVYRGSLEEVCVFLAKTAPDKSQFEARMTEAEQGLLAASCEGLDRGAYELGQFYLEWATDETDPASRLRLAPKAAAALERALALEPNTEVVWRQSAAADILLLGKKAEGQAKIQRAAELSRNQDPRGYANYYAARSSAAGSLLLKRQYGSYAMEYYDKALKNTATTGAATFSIQMAKAKLAIDLGDADQAIAALSQAANMTEEPDYWQAEKALASIYAARGDTASSEQHLARAKEGMAAARQSAPLKNQDVRQ